MADLTKLDKRSFSTDELTSKYKGYLAPHFDINIEGRSVNRLNMTINSLNIDTSMEKADTFSFTVTNAFDPVAKEFAWLDQYLSVSKNIEISIGYTDVLESVFKGYITSVRYELDSEQTLVVVSGLDNSFKLMRGVKSQVYKQATDSDVAKLVISRAGLTGQVDNTSITYDMIQQSSTSDYQFLSRLAERNGYEFFVSGQNVYFRSPPTAGAPVLTLTWGQNLLSLHKEDDLNDQTGTVTVRSWDHKTKKVLAGKADSVSIIGSGQDGGALLKKALGTAVEDNYFSEARSVEQARAEANAIKNRSAMKLVSGEATCIGTPEIRAGKFVQLAGLGKKLSHSYYITSARHCIDESGYLTTLTIGGNAV